MTRLPGGGGQLGAQAAGAGGVPGRPAAAALHYDSEPGRRRRPLPVPGGAILPRTLTDGTNI